MLMFAGQMSCEALNWVLKRYIKEERPRGETDHTQP
jgi:dolichyldiphosphatase